MYMLPCYSIVYQCIAFDICRPLLSSVSLLLVCLCCLALLSPLLSGSVVWLCCLALLSGSVVWLCCLALFSGSVVWLCCLVLLAALLCVLVYVFFWFDCAFCL